MAGRPRRGILVDGEVVSGSSEGERERLKGDKVEVDLDGERVTFDDILAELGEFGREQKVNVDDVVIIYCRQRKPPKEPTDKSPDAMGLPFVGFSIFLSGMILYVVDPHG